jgi:lysophospholipase L1-like esterase
MRSLWMRVAAVTLSLLAVSLFLEIALRVADYEPFARLADASSSMVRPVDDPDLQYELVPNSRDATRKNPIGINELGFRGRTVPTAKPQGTWRLAVLGDSISFAGPLEESERFSELTEGRLRKKRPGSKIDVLNFGTGGYDVLNEVARYESLAKRFEPDIVAVAFCVNDVGVHSVNLRTLRFIDEYGWLTRRLRVLQWFVVRGEQRSLEDQFVELNTDANFSERYADRITKVGGDAKLAGYMRQLEGLLQGNDTRLGPKTAHPFLPWYTSDAKIGRLRYAFARLARTTAESRTPTVVVIVPYLKEGSFTRAYRLVYEIIEHEARRVGFDVVQLRDAFVDADLKEVRNKGFVHPNALGHEIIADGLSSWIEGSGYRPSD